MNDQDRYRGSLLGLATDDALGTTLELGAEYQRNRKPG